MKNKSSLFFKNIAILMVICQICLSVSPLYAYAADPSYAYADNTEYMQDSNTKSAQDSNTKSTQDSNTNENYTIVESADELKGTNESNNGIEALKDVPAPNSAAGLNNDNFIVSEDMQKDPKYSAADIAEDAETLIYIDTTLSVSVGKYQISATGNMPEGATLSVSRVYNTKQLEEVIGDEDYSINVAFDIEILVDGQVWQPVDHGKSVSINITGADIPEDQELKVYRIENEAVEAGEAINDDSVIELNAVLSNDGDVVVETEHFTVYTFGTTSVTVDGTAAYLKTGTEFKNAITSLVSSPSNIVWSSESFTGTDIATAQSGSRSVYARVSPEDATVVELYTDAGTVFLNADSSYMLSGLSGTTKIDFISDDRIDTSLCTNMSHMFDGDSALTSLGKKLNTEIGVKNFDTSNVTDFSYMFYNCEKLFMDTNSWNVSNGIDFSYMFSGCKSIISIDMSGWTLSHAQNMKYFLQGCSNLRDVNAADIDVSKITDFSGMFQGCNKLSVLDLSTWDVSSGTSFEAMISDCTGLERLYAPKVISSSANILLCAGSWNIDNDLDGESDDGNTYNTLKESTGVSYTYCRAGISTLIPGTDFNTKIKRLVTGSTSTTYQSTDSTITSITWVNTDISTYADSVELQESGPKVWAHKSGTVIQFYTTAEKVHTNKNVSFMFYNLAKLTNLDVSGFDTSKSTDFSAMFHSCATLTNLDISSFNTSNGTDFSHMFYGCKSLASLDVSGFDTSNGMNFSYMFSGCSALTNLDVSGFDTTNNTSFSSMFYNCISLTSLDVSSFNTSKGTDFNCMFYGCKTLTSLDVSSFNTSKGTDFNCMFWGCQKLASLDVSNFNTSKVANFNSMFNACCALTSLDVSGFDTSNGTKFSYMFYNCSHLTSLDLSNFNTSKGTDFSFMFYYCTNLTSLDISSFNTSNSTNFNNMFGYCYSLTSLDVSNFDTSNGTNFNGMFYYCQKLTNLNLSNFDTSKGTNFHGMFYGCSGLTSLNINKFDTKESTDFGYMFYNCNKLTSLDLSNFDTSNGTDFSYMFSNCGNLTDLDISGFDTSKGIDFSYMFDYCVNLQCLDMSSFTIQNNTDTTLIILYCQSLKEYIAPQIISGNAEIILPPGTWHLDNDNNNEADNDKTYSILKGTINTSNRYINLESSSEDEPECDYAVLQNGKTFSTMIKRFNGTSYDYEAVLRYNIVWITTDISNENNVVQVQSEGAKIYAKKIDNATIGLYTTASTVYLNEDSSYLLFRTDIYRNMFIADNRINSSRCKNFSYMFACNINNGGSTSTISSSLSYDGMSEILNNLDTSSGTNFFGMFSGCKITDLDLSSLDTSSGTNFAHMFSGCSALTSLDLSNLNTSSCTDFSYMFKGCTGLTNLDLSSFDTSKGTNFYSMFLSCSKLTSLDVSSFDTSNGTNFSWMFDGCSALTSLDLSSFDTLNGVDFTCMFSNNCSSLLKIKAPSSIVNAITLPGGSFWYLDDNEDNIMDSNNAYMYMIRPVTNEPHTYIKGNLYAVRYVIDGDTTIVPEQIYSTLSSPKAIEPNLEFVGRTLDAWYTDNELTDKYDFSSILTGDLILYGTLRNNSYQISFDPLNGLLTGENSKEITYGHSYGSLPTASLEDNYFAGWWFGTPGDLEVKPEGEKKYSHTSNINDDGSQSGNYGNSYTMNDVVSIPGAEGLHITITYGGESASYDWVCMWSGNHPSYTAKNNYSTSETGKLGGGNHTSAANIKEYWIPDDTVTFAFKSDGNGYGDGYGYYAVIEEAQAGSYNYVSQIRSKDIVLLTEDSTVYAKYSSTKLSFPVHFETNGGSSVADQTIDFGGYVTEPEAPVKEGYKMNGWYYDKELTIPWYFEFDTVDGETTLYAAWALDSTYTVSCPAQIIMTDEYNDYFAGAGDTLMTRYAIFDIQIEGISEADKVFMIGAACSDLWDESGNSITPSIYHQLVGVPKDSNFPETSPENYAEDFEDHYSSEPDPQSLNNTKVYITPGGNFKCIDNMLLRCDFPTLGKYDGTMIIKFKMGNKPPSSSEIPNGE